MIPVSTISPSRFLRARPHRRAHGTVFLPKEHGSWSLALEPITLGLLAAPSLAGAALGLAGFAGFLARRPVRAIAQGSGGRDTWIAAGLLIGCGLAAFVCSARLVSPAMLARLLVLAPGAILFVICDIQGESRAASAELAGSATFALLPFVLASFAGESTASAISLTLLALARSLPTVIMVRWYLRWQKGQATPRLAPLLAGLGGLALTILLAALRLVPWLAVSGASLLWIRTGWWLSSRRPRWSARRIGVTEALLGVAYTTLVVLAYRS
ncbi:MAG: YwiC-like family protein [Opitutaceae bacterium]